MTNKELIKIFGYLIDLYYHAEEESNERQLASVGLTNVLSQLKLVDKDELKFNSNN